MPILAVQVRYTCLWQGMLGIFQKLVASRVHDQDGFRILESLLESAPPETLQPYMPQVRLRFLLPGHGVADIRY